MRVLNFRNKHELLNEIRNFNGMDEEVYIPVRPTIEIVDELLRQSPNLKKIFCPPSLYLQISKKVFKSLESSETVVQPGDFKVGRPKKYADDTIRRVVSDRESGKPAKAISREHEMPLRTVYYYLKNGLR